MKTLSKKTKARKTMTPKPDRPVYIVVKNDLEADKNAILDWSKAINGKEFFENLPS